MGTQGSLVSDRVSVRYKYFDPTQAPPLALDTEPPPDRRYNWEELDWQKKKLPVGGMGPHV